MRIVACGLIALASFCNQEKLPPKFEFDGKPIHPGCVYELQTCLADKEPIVHAVDVRGCTKSNRHALGKVEKDDDGWTYWNEDLFDKGWFDYSVVGSTSDGVFVLATRENGGGTLTTSSILFVALEDIRYFNEDHFEKRTVLRGLGEMIFENRRDTVLRIKEQNLVLTLNGKDRIVEIPKKP